uniref:Ferredoxin n=1 Tax=Ignisphaera aggregans TaxID=334771 RepID=A0A7C2VNR4_9CREN
MAKVTVNKELCIACGVCWSLAPDVFEMDPSGGKTKIKAPYVAKDDDKSSEGNIPDNLVEAAKNAASSCPVGAINVE